MRYLRVAIGVRIPHPTDTIWRKHPELTLDYEILRPEDQIRATRNRGVAFPCP